MNHSAKATILIVEDETIVALDMRQRLEKLGYQVCGIASTAAIAIDKYRQCRPDLVLMDIKLKGDQDGIEAATVIQQEGGPPVIFVTAFTDAATIERVHAASPFGYIVKPFHEREVSIAIELALSKYAHQKALEKAKQAAEESNQAKSSFLSNISHELKTPLNSIIGFVDLAFQLAENDDIKEYLLFAGRGARRLEASINAILDYTKLEHNALVPISSEFYLEDLLSRVWEPYAPDAYAKGLAISLFIDPRLPESLHGDANKLGTILKNLVENAVKFTTNGYVRLAAEYEIVKDRPYLHISISDSGTGITKEKLQNLFDPFSQGDASYTRLFEGLGLGLCLVKKLTDLMGIELRVQAERLEGTCVELLLPLPEMADALPDKSATPASRVRIASFGLPTVIADDLVAMLSCLGAQCYKLDVHAMPSIQFDLLYVELAAWFKLSESDRSSLFACVGCVADRLIILGSPTDPYCYVKKPESYFRRPYPLLLSVLREDVERSEQYPVIKLSEAKQDKNRLSEACFDQIEIPVFTPPELKAEGDSFSVYRRLVEEVVSDSVDNPETRQHLETVWQELSAAFDAQDFHVIERCAKHHFDTFSDQGNKTAARLMLALLMDTRKGPGPWIHDMHRLLRKNLFELSPIIDTHLRRIQ